MPGAHVDTRASQLTSSLVKPGFYPNTVSFTGSERRGGPNSKKGLSLCGHFEVRSNPETGDLKGYSVYPLFSGYHVDPLLKKEVFTMENQVCPKNTLKKHWYFQ